MAERCRPVIPGGTDHPWRHDVTMADERHSKRFFKLGKIEPSTSESAVIVNYILEDEDGVRKDAKKKIRVTLNAHSNIGRIAEQVIEKCKLLSVSQLGDVERVLQFLKQKQFQEDERAESQLDGDERRARRGVSDKYLDQQQEHGAQFFGYYTKGAQQAGELEEAMQLANLDDVDSYVEKLYEEMEDKIKGTYMVLQLARNPDNLEVRRRCSVALRLRRARHGNGRC